MGPRMTPGRVGTRTGGLRFVVAVIVVLAPVVTACRAETSATPALEGGGATAVLVDRIERLGEMYDRSLGRDWPGGSPEGPASALLAGLRALRDGDVDAAASVGNDVQASTTAVGEARLVTTSEPFLAPAGQLTGPWPSSLTQGLALALFDGLAAAGDAEAASIAGELALGYLVPVEEGGFTRRLDEGVFLDEYPTSEPSLSLPGHVIATVALRDHLVASPSADLVALADDAVAWLEAHVAEYDVTDADGLVSPASALGIRNADMILRVVGTGEAAIARIAVSVGQDTIELELGTKADGAADRPVRLLIDDTYHNWEGVDVVGGRTVRVVRGGAGRDDHAPFVVDVPAAESTTARRRIEVDAAVTGEVWIERLWGDVYLPLVELAPSTTIRRVGAALPSEAEVLAAFVGPRVAETVEAVAVLADVEQSGVLAAAVERWTPALELVPGRYDARALPALELDLDAFPILATEPGPESIHLEYPSVLIGDSGAITLLYSAYGDDGTWRIHRAESDDSGRTWVRTGTLIDGADVGWGVLAFPDVVTDAVSGDVIVVFSADADPGSTGYDSIALMRGPDLDSLGPPVVIIDEPGLDPAAWWEDDELHISYTLVDGEVGETIEHRVSADGETFERAPQLLGPGFSIYTQNTFELDGVRVWAVNENRGRRLSARLYCSPDGRTLAPIEGSEFAVTDVDDPVWNHYRYGFEVVDLGADEGLVAFYNGIRLDEGDGNGMIGRTRLDLSGLAIPDSCV